MKCLNSKISINIAVLITIFYWGVCTKEMRASCAQYIKEAFSTVAHRIELRDGFGDMIRVFKNNTRELNSSQIPWKAKEIEFQQPNEYSKNHLSKAWQYRENGSDQEAFNHFMQQQSSSWKSAFGHLNFSKRKKVEEAIFQGIGLRKLFFFKDHIDTKILIQESDDIYIGIPSKNLESLDVLLNNFYMLMSPATEYGFEAQNKVATAIRILLDEVNSPQFSQTVRIAENENRFGALLRFARKVMDPPELNERNPASQRALYEGITTIFQAISLLSTHKVPGIESMDDLVRLLTQDPNGNSLLLKFSMSVSQGFVGPMAQNGYKFADPPLKFVDGKLDFSAQFKKLNEIVKEIIIVVPGENNFFTGKGCPIGIRFSRERQSPLQDLFDEFYRIYSNI